MYDLAEATLCSVHMVPEGRLYRCFDSLSLKYTPSKGRLLQEIIDVDVIVFGRLILTKNL